MFLRFGFVSVEVILLLIEFFDLFFFFFNLLIVTDWCICVWYVTLGFLLLYVAFHISLGGDWVSIRFREKEASGVEWADFDVFKDVLLWFFWELFFFLLIWTDLIWTFVVESIHSDGFLLCISYLLSWESEYDEIGVSTCYGCIESDSFYRHQIHLI